MEDMKIIAWTVKTPKGIIRPEWSFDNKEEAEDFAEKLNDEMHPHKWVAVEVEIKIISK